jgi:hypothetical protein
MRWRTADHPAKAPTEALIRFGKATVVWPTTRSGRELIGSHPWGWIRSILVRGTAPQRRFASVFCACECNRMWGEFKEDSPHFQNPRVRQYPPNLGIAMAQQPSKADRIRKLLHLSNAEIAKRIECHDGYVRAVRQRTSAGGNPVNSNAILAYAPTEYERRRERYASDPTFREKVRAQRKEWTRRRRDEARAS